MLKIISTALSLFFIFSFNSFAQQPSKKEERKEHKLEKKKEKEEKKSAKQNSNSSDPIGLNKEKEFGESDKQSKALLEKVSKKYKGYKTLRANFVLKIETADNKIQDEQKGTIQLQGDKYRLDLNGQQVICDHATIWTYLKESKEVQINKYSPDKKSITPSQIFTVYEKDFLSAPIEQATENNTPVQIVDVTPIDKSKSFFKIKITLSKKDNSIKRFKVFDKNGNRYVYEIQKLEPNVSLNDTVFFFNPKNYPGVEVIDLR